MPAASHDHYDPPTLVARTGKRKGAALSCAECRRSLLSARCSRVFPCSNCVKKGCSAICPDGALTTGKGNRFVLANTESLHDKINELSNRVRHLEDALKESHALHSVDPHPLLSEQLLKIKRPLERERPEDSADAIDKDGTEDAIDALGSLSISNSGRAAFFGTAANAWYLLKNEVSEDDTVDMPTFDVAGMPSDMSWHGHAFPFTVPVRQSSRELKECIFRLLPDATTAKYMIDTYYRHAAWMYTPIPERDFYETVYEPIYNQPYEREDGEYPVGAHELGLLCIIFAMGVLLDLTRKPYPPEAMRWYQVSRAALSIDSVFDHASIPATQALLIMCHYMFFSNMEGRWVMMGVVVKLAQMVSISTQEGRKWNLDDAETFKRSCLLWEIYVYDSWQSLTYGRPPSFSLDHIDTKLPFETERKENGELEMSFQAWKHRFASQCQSIVHDRAFGARVPSYKEVKELDRKIDNFYMPPSLQIPGFGGPRAGREEQPPPLELTMQRHIAFAIKEITRFYLHRGFFARALEESPADPMGSKYGSSVLAAYNSATAFVNMMQSLYRQQPQLAERMWFLFTHVFSCAIVLGSLAIKGPTIALARSAFQSLDMVYTLFYNTSNPSGQKVLPILAKLRDRARTALSSVPLASSPPIKKEVDELTVLGGTTRLVSHKTNSNPSSPANSNSPAESPSAHVSPS
ncbi:hypothetical protein FISHEDRAFT_34165, partial [Fistulina hepatica ATCC 64428]